MREAGAGVGPARTGGIALGAVLGGTLLGCRSHDVTHLVVGIQSDPMGGVVSALHVVIRVAGAVVDDERIQPPHGSRVGFPQPWEKTLSGAGKGTAKVDVEVEAIGGDPGAKPLFSRLSSTHFAPGRTVLLRVPLEARCIVYPVVPRGATKVPGPLSGPTCTAPATCIMGACQSSEVPPARLEPYAPGWPTNAPDRCKPRNGGPPDLQVGTGQSYYVPVTPMQVLQAEAGPQGGHHIWIAARMKNLKQSLSTTRIEGIQPDTGTAIPPSTFVFSYAPDQGGFCKLYGLRLQLDNASVPVQKFLGQPLEVRVVVTDSDGTSAQASARVGVAATTIGD